MRRVRYPARSPPPDPVYYDPTQPVAVFLGPSLPRARAEAVLPANYYPPVRRGDIYRLLGTGVRVIVIIDGVFHFTTPVWPREIAAALSLGIVVIGASSMGALRAAELEPLGMIGVGEVFAAYRNGLIDGDDEVALLHADVEHGFRVQSEAMVNMRHNLARAVGRGLLDRQVADGVLAAAKTSFFGDRSYDALLRAPQLQALQPDRMSQLRSFLRTESEDLKQLDALAALEEGRRRLAQWTSPDRNVRSTGGGRRNDFALLELLDRGVWRTDGVLVSIRSIVQQAVASNRIDAAHLREAAARFYVDRWIDAHLGNVPPDVSDASESGVDADALRRIGLTAEEMRVLRHRRAQHDWLLEQEPERFGIDFSTHRRCLEPMLARAWSATPVPVDRTWLAQVARQARRSALITRWARGQGIVCPESDVDAFMTEWEASEGIVDRRAAATALTLTEDEYVALWAERACYHWLLDKGPGYFGFDSFSYDAAIVGDWQLSGEIVTLAAGMTT